MKDKYELELDKKFIELRECQDSKDIDSCIKCNDEYRGCLLRLDYVKSVYSSLAKDKEGNFEF